MKCFEDFVFKTLNSLFCSGWRTLEPGMTGSSLENWFSAT